MTTIQITLDELLAALVTMTGTTWTLPNGESLSEALASHADEIVRGAGRNSDKRRSRIGEVWVTEAGEAWDFGFADCWCWEGAGHDDACTAKEGK